MPEEPKRYDSRAWTGDISPGPAPETVARKPMGAVARLFNWIFPLLSLLFLWAGSLLQLIRAQTEHRIRLRHHDASMHGEPISYAFSVMLNLVAFLGASAMLIAGLVLLRRRMKARKAARSRPPFL